MTSELLDIYLPGQPVALPKGPLPQLGQGLYLRDGQVRASVIGSPLRTGVVSDFILLRFKHCTEYLS